MKSGLFLRLALIAAIFAALPLIMGMSPPATQDETINFSKSANQFAMDMYKGLAEKPGNLFFSPFSIRQALAMAHAGAGGQTKAQMEKVLRLEHCTDKVWMAFGKHLESLNEHEKIELHVADSLWAQENFGFYKKYIKTVRRAFAADIKFVNFIKNAQAVGKDIAAWIKHQTMGLVDGDPPPLDPLTRLVICDTIYFKGYWANMFDKANTHKALFYTTKGKRRQVDMMHVSNQFKYNYLENDLVQVLELPYDGCGISMIIVLPKDKQGLGKIEAMLSPEQLESWKKALKRKKVIVSLPKFKADQRLELKNTLAQMGMPDAFVINKANFSRMAKKPLYIAKVIHQAFVQVDESGTEAAAATTIIMRLKSIREKPVFCADHPFIFFIQDTQTDCILFAGRIDDPQPQNAEEK